MPIRNLPPTAVKAIVAPRVLSTKDNTLTPPTLPAISPALHAPAMTATAPLNTLKDHFELYPKPPGEVGREIKNPSIESDKGNSKEYPQGETQEAGVLNWLVDSIYNAAGAFQQERVRPAKNIDFQPSLSPEHSNTLDTLAKEIEVLDGIPRHKLIAHLVGAGGIFDFARHSGRPEILTYQLSLAGLPREVSGKMFPSIFAGVTLLTQDLLRTKGIKGHGEASTWDPILKQIAKCWDKKSSLADLGEFLYGASESRTAAPSMAVVPTGWMGWPCGHAVGFVYALEKGEPVVYACNTATDENPHRTIVKYAVEDEQLFKTFLNSADKDNSLIENFWKSGTHTSGLKRCPEEEQIPLEITRVRQRRGNCSIASRKSCQLAMMWSLGSREGLSPQEIKTVYKATTTLLRGVGVRAALNSDDPLFLGVTLASMLSKWNRPDCRRDAYRLADGILKHHGEPQSGLDYSRVSAEELNSDTSLSFVKRARDVLKLDLNKRGLLSNARWYQNHEVVALAHRLNTK